MDDQTRQDFIQLRDSLRDIRDRMVSWSEAIEHAEDYPTDLPMSKPYIVLEMFLKLRQDMEAAKELAKKLGTIDITIRGRRCHYRLPRLIANELFLAAEIIGWGNQVAGWLDHENLQGKALEHYEARVNWAARETAPNLLRLLARLDCWLNWRQAQGDSGYLGIKLDPLLRTASRFGTTAEFNNNNLPWQFFLSLFQSGPMGASARALEERLYPKIGGDLYKLAGRTRDLVVAPLGVLIEPENGKWLLKPNPAREPPQPAEEPIPF